MSPGDASNGGPQTWFQLLAYEPLIASGPDGEPAPGLATDWGYVDGSGGTQFRLNLRDDAEFADGTPVTAEAVAASITWFVANATGPTSGSFTGWTVEATGDLEVTITTPAPTPIVADLLNPYNLGGNIISPEGLKNADTLANATYGAGPYVYDSADSVTGDHYTYVPNENYYDQSRIRFDKIVIRVIANMSSALSAVRSGQVDAIQGDTTVVESAESAGLDVVGAPNGFYGFFIWDWAGLKSPALADQRVRQALNYAIDRESIASAVFGDLGTATSQPTTPGWDGYDDSLTDAYPYDPDKAEALLAEAGYADGFSFDLPYASYDPNGSKLIQAAVEQLKQVGVTVNLTPCASLAELVDALNAGTFSGTSLFWGGQTQYANTNQLWLPQSPVNPYKNLPVPGLEDAFAAYSAADETDRGELAQAVEEIVVDQALSVPIAQVDSVYIHNAELQGVQVDPRGNLNNPADWSK
ncbi:hypothetical protein ASF46_14425 [Rathayibacter sp. Leaf296]|nr:hypothetical protein ASF46_14425 [Rathayibacter sp. Leaf296]